MNYNVNAMREMKQMISGFIDCFYEVLVTVMNSVKAMMNEGIPQNCSMHKTQCCLNGDVPIKYLIYMGTLLLYKLVGIVSNKIQYFYQQ